MNHTLIGEVAGYISLAAYALYILSTLFPKKFFGQETKPNRATWWILTLIGALIVESNYESGAIATNPIALSYFFGPLIIAIISLNKKYGVGGWEGNDKWCLLGAILCLGFRVVFKQYPTAALILELGVDFFGLLPTIQKSYKTPGNEDKIAWAIELGACVVNMFAIERWSDWVWVYPTYLLIINAVVVALLYKNEKCHRIVKSITKLFALKLANN